MKIAIWPPAGPYRPRRPSIFTLGSLGGVFLFSVLFIATGLQILPIIGDAIRLKHLLVLALLGYFAFYMVPKARGRIAVSQELLVFSLLYLLCGSALMLNGLLLGPREGYLEGCLEFFYLLPLVFILYALFDRAFEFRESFVQAILILFFGSILTFFAIFSLKAGINVVGVFKTFFAGEGTLQYLLFAQTFAHIDSEAGSSARHAMMYLFFLLLVILRVARDMECPPGQRAGVSLSEAGLVVVILVIGMSRKVVLALMLFMLLYLLISARFGGRRSALGNLGLILIVGALCGGLAVAAFTLSDSAGDEGAAKTYKRKYVQDVLENDRIVQYKMSVDEVGASATRVISGVGLGSRIKDDGHFPHNLLFYSLHQAGIVGFIPALLLYGYVVLLLCRSALTAFGTASRDVAYFSLGGFACLLIPFTRMTVGDKGGLALEGSIGLVIAFMFLEQARQRALRARLLHATPPAAAPASAPP